MEMIEKMCRKRKKGMYGWNVRSTENEEVLEFPGASRTRRPPSYILFKELIWERRAPGWLELAHLPLHFGCRPDRNKIIWWYVQSKHSPLQVPESIHTMQGSWQADNRADDGAKSEHIEKLGHGVRSSANYRFGILGWRPGILGRDRRT